MKPPKPVKSAFIVGCQHSGTSLLIRMLGEHSHIYAIPYETKIFREKRKRVFLFFKKQDLDGIAELLNHFDQLTRTEGKHMWVEKTPMHVLHIDKILKFRPDAKIIGMTRDPRDAACSIRAAGYIYEKNFEESVLRWINDNTQLLKHRKKVHIVKLEDLVANPQKYIKGILEFLQLPYANLLNYHLHQKSWYSCKIIKHKPGAESGIKNHRMLRNWQINQPIFKTTQRYHQDMTDEDKKIFNKYFRKIEPLAKQLGYSLE